jgi:hypothetical protein
MFAVSLSLGSTSAVFANETETPSANSQAKTEAQKSNEAAAVATAKTCKANALKAFKTPSPMPSTKEQKVTNRRTYNSTIRACNAALKAVKANNAAKSNKPAKPMKSAKP